MWWKYWNKKEKQVMVYIHIALISFAAGVGLSMILS